YGCRRRRRGCAATARGRSERCGGRALATAAGCEQRRCGLARDPGGRRDYAAKWPPGTRARAASPRRDAMKRLMPFALLAVAAWYGWKHPDELRPSGMQLNVA